MTGCDYALISQFTRLLNYLAFKYFLKRASCTKFIFALPLVCFFNNICDQFKV